MRSGRFRLSQGEVENPRFEAGDGHKHGCLDAFTIALGSYLDYGRQVCHECLEGRRRLRD